MPIEAPPAKTAKTSSNRTAKTPASNKRVETRSDALQGYFGIVSLGALAKGWYADSRAITAHAEPISNELAKLGEDNEQLGQTLDLLCKTGPYMGLVMAMMPLVLQILANHGRVPVEAGMTLGVVPPAALEAQAKQEIAQVAATALKQQKDAEKALASAQRELAENSLNGQPERVNVLD